MAIVGLGTDIVEISRMHKSLAKSPALAKRVLHQSEWLDFVAIAEAEMNLCSEQQSIRVLAQQARFLAKRFAAKEAAVKAIGNGIGNGISWQHMQIKHHPSGQPYLYVTEALATLFASQGVTHSHVSISDETSYAVATVILEQC